MWAFSQRLEAVEQREGQYAESVNSQGREVVALQQQLAKYLEQHAGVRGRVMAVEESVTMQKL